MRYTFILIGINAAVFVVQALVGGFTDAFLLASADVLARPWILVTSMFLHGDLGHILFNMLALFFFGLVLEGIIGGRKFVLLYMAGGIIASLAALPFYDAALGASGAVFAVMGATAYLRPRMTVWVYMIPMPMAVAAVLWFAIDMLGVFVPGGGIANAAHIAGLLFGVASGLYWHRFRERRKRMQRMLSDDEMYVWEEKHMR